MIIEQLDDVPPRFNAAPGRHEILGNELAGFAGTLGFRFGQTDKRCRGVRVD